MENQQTVGPDSADSAVCTEEQTLSQSGTDAAKKIEELQKKIDSITAEFKDFVYIISHDLKAPLRAIKALADWISADYADKFDAEGKEQLKMLIIRVDRLNNLLEGVLQYSRIGRITENKVPIELNELVHEVSESLNAPPGIKITIENKLPTVVSEPTRIRQVFENLIGNAVRFMGKPEGSVKIGCVEEGNFWKFSVSDTGPGIDQQYFEKIFKLFQTLQAKDQFESTGVGLTITKKIVELYGGKIWLTSKVGEGTTFYFTLPKQATAAECQVAANAAR